jgi:hypothetical protein
MVSGRVTGTFCSTEGDRVSISGDFVGNVESEE